MTNDDIKSLLVVYKLKKEKLFVYDCNSDIWNVDFYDSDIMMHPVDVEMHETSLGTFVIDKRIACTVSPEKYNEYKFKEFKEEYSLIVARTTLGLSQSTIMPIEMYGLDKTVSK